MQSSVPNPSAVQATFAATLFDEWYRHGLREVVVCPGSRSTPLAIAAAGHGGLAVHVRVDERSAGFFAVGRALATSTPVAIVVTSGTAAAELHAAVAEADLAGVALLVVTADRPSELHGVGAPQTIEQRDLYQLAVRRFEEPGVARLEASSSWRPLASRCWRAAVGVDGSGGPVHVNVAFVEPLVADPLQLPGGRVDGEPWRRDEPRSVLTGEIDVRGRRVLAVVGRGVHRETVASMNDCGWAVVGDATVASTIAHYDGLLRDSGFADAARPDVVVRLGGLPASKVLGEQLRRWRIPAVAWRGCGSLSDPDGTIGVTYPGLPDFAEQRLHADGTYREFWVSASTAVEQWLEERESVDGPLSEPDVARAVVTASSEHAVALVVGSSMPVRDVEWWAAPRTSPTFANRGANGIDGVVSTVMGVGSGGSVIGLVGDVTFLHDVSGLVDGLGTGGGRCVLVVVDNNGGGIFSFLSQATALSAPDFESLFGTPRQHDLEAVARAFGHQAVSVSTRATLRAEIDAGLLHEGVTVVVARVPDRTTNVTIHDEYVAGVAGVWRSNPS